MVAVLARYGMDVPERTGWRKVKCPFHSDRIASASVNTDIGAFSCHACGVSGDVYGILMSQEGIDFRAALALGDGLDADPNTDTPKSSGRRVRKAWRPPGRRGRR